MVLTRAFREKMTWLWLLLASVMLSGEVSAQGFSDQDSTYFSKLYSASELRYLRKLTKQGEENVASSQFDKAIAASEEALTIALKSVYPSILKLRNFTTLARAFKAKEQLGYSLKFYLRSVKEAERLEDWQLQRDAYIETASFYEEWGFLTRSLEYLNKATKLVEIHDSKLSAIPLLTKALSLYEQQEMYDQKLHTEETILECSIAHELGDSVTVHWLLAAAKTATILRKHDTAIGYLDRALEIGQAHKDTVTMAKANLGMGMTYKALSEYHKSLENLIEYCILCKKIDMDSAFETQYANTLLTIGVMYQELGDLGMANGYKHAINYLYRKLNLSIANADHENIAYIYNRISMIYAKLDEYTKTVDYAEKALYFASVANSTKQKMVAHFRLYEVYLERNHHKKALAQYRSYSELSQQLFEEELKAQKQLISKEIAENRRQFIINKTEQMIVEEEVDTLSYRQLSLEAERQEQQLELLIAQAEIQDFTLKNEQLKNEKAEQRLQLIQQAFEAEKKEKQIALLKKDKEIQALALKQKTLEELENKRAIELLEKDRTLKALELKEKEAKSQLYFWIIVLATLILSLLLVFYLLSHKANRKLSHQKRQIERQAKHLKKSNETLELLGTIGQDITAHLSTDGIIDILHERVQELMDASVLAIGINNQAKKLLEFPYVKENGESVSGISLDLQKQDSLAQICCNQQEEIFIRDFDQEYTRYFTEMPTPHVGEKHAKSIIYVPMLVKGKVIGLLTVQSFKANAFNANHLNIIRNIANYTKVAIENARAYQKIRKQSKHLGQANLNIHEQKAIIEKKNDELMALNEEKNHLIGILAHDLRNPLAISISLVDFIGMHPENLRDEQLEGIRITARSLNRMNEMISKILDVRAIESKHINLQTDRVVLQEVAQVALDNYRKQASDKKIGLSMEAPDPSIVAELDRSYTIQIIENLISNALKFSPKGKCVKVNIAEHNNMVRLSVCDQGPGIPHEDFAKLFQKFKKLSAKPTNGEASTGLGLSIVKKFTEAMRGRVWCESTPGNGATFVVEFPKAAVRAVSA